MPGPHARRHDHDGGAVSPLVGMAAAVGFFAGLFIPALWARLRLRRGDFVRITHEIPPAQSFPRCIHDPSPRPRRRAS